MQLEQITANIRLRSSWEAIDLGFSMVQTWWKSIYPALIIFNLLFLIPAFIFVPVEYYFTIVLFFWWVKPYSHRLILHILSQKLFNNDLSTIQALRDLPALLRHSSLGALTFRRFSFSRGFNLPIWQLEQLKGKERAKRQSVLLGAVHSEAIWLTLGLAFIEIILSLSVIGLFVLFIPADYLEPVLKNIFNPKLGSIETWMTLTLSIIFIIVTIIIEPFYIGASFALYINRRTQLEAWDIELAFRNIAKRLKAVAQKTLSIVAIITLSISMVFILPADSVYAEVSEESASLRDTSEVDYLYGSRLLAGDAKVIIADIINSKDLKGEKTQTEWKLKSLNDPDELDPETAGAIQEFLKPIALIFATIIEYALWILLLIALIVLYLTRDKWMYLLSSEADDEEEYQAPDILFGMDIRKESLPADIAKEARHLWQQQQTRESLSLLYRGALAQLVNQEKILLEASHTEGDILKLSAKSLNQNKQQYLNQLTTAWQLIAYAHRTPNDDAMNWLFSHWHSDFANNGEPSHE